MSTFAAFSSLIQLGVFLVAFLCLADRGLSEEGESRVYFLFFSLGPLLSFVGFLIFGKALQAGVDNGRYGLAKAFLILSLPMAIAVFGISHIGNLIYFTYDAPAPQVPFSVFRFLAGTALFASVAATLAFFFHARPVRLPLAAKVIGFATVASLFDVYLMTDSFCFSPYIGPALLVAEGQIPLVDAFSQYGPNFLIFSAAFSVLPKSFYTVAAIMSLLNVLMYAALIGIAVNVSRNKLPILVASVCSVLFMHSAHLYNISITPSVFAMRFLPPLLLIFSLTLLRPSRIFSGLSLFCLAVCSFWSLEALVFGTAAYLAYAVLCAIGERFILAQFARSLVGVVGAALLPHLMLSALYWIVWRVMPDYQTYFQLVFVHLKSSDYWKLPIEPGIRVWALFGFVYATALSISLQTAYRSFRDKKAFPRSSAIVGALSVLGVLMFYYYIGRSATPILMFISLPLFAIAFISLDWTIGEMSSWEKGSGRPAEVFAPVILVAWAIGFPLMGGVFADRFFRPFRQDMSNSTVLRGSILPIGEKPISSVVERLRTVRKTIASPDGMPPNETSGSLTYFENNDAFELIKQLDDGKRRFLVFLADPVPVLFHTPPARRQNIVYPPHQRGITYPAVDGLSANLSARALSTLNAVAAGDVVLVGEFSRPPLDNDALEKLRRDWTLCNLPSKPKVSAYILRAKKEPTCR